jgi:Arc/MetJ-type ribon-helix-helix transcriptional regulator
MGTVKVSVTLDEKRVAEIKALVGEGGFSRYVDEALMLRLQHDGILQFFAELDEEFGPVPDDIQEQVRKESEKWPR